MSSTQANGNGSNGGTNGASQNQPSQPANAVRGAFPGMPLSIPAGSPRPPFNQGIWEEQRDGSLVQITANYRGAPLKTDRVCGNSSCGITRSREWRRRDGIWYCSACGNYWNSFQHHRVPKPDSHISVPRRKPIPSRAGAALLAMQNTFPARQTAPSQATAPLPVLATPPANVHSRPAFPDSNVRSNIHPTVFPTQQHHDLAFPPQATLQPSELIDPALLSASYTTTSTAQSQQFVTSPLGGRMRVQDLQDIQRRYTPSPATAQGQHEEFPARVSEQPTSANDPSSAGVFTITGAERRLVVVSRMLQEGEDASYVSIRDAMIVDDEEIAAIVKDGRMEDAMDGSLPFDPALFNGQA